MTEWLLPVGVAATALVLTYLMCLRPMRRGHCPAAGVHAHAATHRHSRGGNDELDGALERARAEVARLQARHDRQAHLPATPPTAPAGPRGPGQPRPSP